MSEIKFDLITKNKKQKNKKQKKKKKNKYPLCLLFHGKFSFSLDGIPEIMFISSNVLYGNNQSIMKTQSYIEEFCLKTLVLVGEFEVGADGKPETQNFVFLGLMLRIKDKSVLS